jgi:hypothetical protein
MTTTFNVSENGSYPQARLSPDFAKGGIDIWVNAIKWKKEGEVYTCYAIASAMEGNLQHRKDPKDWKSGDYKWQCPKDYKFAFTVANEGEKCSDVEKALHKILGGLDEGTEYGGKLSLTNAHNPLGLINGMLDMGGVSVPLAPEAIAALGKVIANLVPTGTTLIAEEITPLKSSSGGFKGGFGGGGGQKAKEALEERLAFSLKFLTDALPEEAAIETPMQFVNLYTSPSIRAQSALDALKVLLS